jgi:hypothetical protein
LSAEGLQLGGIRFGAAKPSAARAQGCGCFGGTGSIAGASNATPSSGSQPDISVLLVGNRLEITANVDDKGLEKLKQVLEQYEKILKLLQ